VVVHDVDHGRGLGVLVPTKDHGEGRGDVARGVRRTVAGQRVVGQRQMVVDQRGLFHDHGRMLHRDEDNPRKRARKGRGRGRACHGTLLVFALHSGLQDRPRGGPGCHLRRLAASPLLSRRFRQAAVPAAEALVDWHHHLGNLEHRKRRRWDDLECWPQNPRMGAAVG
jgi:hypothetical protein